MRAREGEPSLSLLCSPRTCSRAALALIPGSLQHAPARLDQRNVITVISRRVYQLALIPLVVSCGGAVHPTASVVPGPDSGQIDISVFLLGDAGAPAPDGEPVLAALSREIRDHGARSIVVFLGDNIYPSGMPDSTDANRAEAERRLDAQLDVLRDTGVLGFFIPGNHDWNSFSPGGWEAIRRQEIHIRRSGNPRVLLLPGDGCPGPSVLDIGPRLRLIFLDTQWWLQPPRKPVHPTSSCPTDSQGEVTDSLRAALQGSGARHVFVFGHHPLVSGGPHGGYFEWTEHIFPLRYLASWLWIPLPIVGSAYPLSRKWGMWPQDLSDPDYTRMRVALEDVLTEHAPLVFASGHDHNLQILGGRGAKYQLVSGAGYYGHTSPVTWRTGTLYAARASGFMRLDVLTSSRVRLEVVTVDAAGRGTKGYSMWLN